MKYLKTRAMLFEDSAIGPNDERQVAQRGYEHNITDYTSRRGQLNAILKKKPEEWEQLATKIIGDNPYLATAWRLSKLTWAVEDAKRLLPTKQGDDLKRAQDDLQRISVEAKQVESDFQRKMADDRKASGN